jgi:hypothetical protein
VVPLACTEKLQRETRKCVLKIQWLQESFQETGYICTQNVYSSEMQWHGLVTSYKLQKNKFMTRLFKYRGKWARPYFMGVFCAGMTSTKRSESANHMLKKVIQRAAPMHLFVSKFNELQSNRPKTVTQMVE